MGKKEKGDVVVKKVGVVGAGLMGGGIAMCCANVGLPVSIFFDFPLLFFHYFLNLFSFRLLSLISTKKVSRKVLTPSKRTT